MRSFSFEATPQDAAAGRLDKAVLARAPRSTRALVAACFAAGGVRADDRPAAKSDRPEPGALVEVADLAETDDRAPAPEPDAPLSVVWEDPQIVAFDKPAGQPCHPVRPLERGTLAGAALARYPELAAVGGDPAIPGLLHRLDAGTSGLVLAARTQAAFDAVRAQLSAHAARKVYLALVEGAVERGGGVSGHLAHADSFRGRMRCVSGGALPGGERPMFAETFYRPLRRLGALTLLEVSIFTGVTHQIRCQLASIGHPVAGDTLYGARPLPAGETGHRLHALSATFVHPATGRETTVRAPEPAWASPAPPPRRPARAGGALALALACALALAGCRRGGPDAESPPAPAAVRPAPAAVLPSPAPVCFVHEDAGPDAKFAQSRAAAAARCLALCGVEAPLFPWAALTNALAEPCRVAHLVFPMRADPTDLAALRDFAARGGHVVVHHSADPALAAFFGLRPPKIPGLAPSKGSWTGFDFLGPPPLHAPASVPQTAPRIVDFVPAGRDVRVLARWRGANPAQGPAALLRGPAGFWLSRPLYDDMPAADAGRLLLSLTATLEPSVWKTAAKTLEARLPDAADLRKLELALRKAAPGAARAAVSARFFAYRKLDGERRAKTAKGLYGSSLAELWEMDRLLLEAEVVAHPLGPDRGKARLAVWAKGGWPPGTNSWDSCAGVLAEAGVTDVCLFAGSLSGSIPAVPGAPADPGRGRRGDPFPAAVKACHARGIRVHAWVFALQADLSDGARYASAAPSKRLLHAPGRTAVLPWLDPAAEANGDDLAAWVRALAAKTGVDGVNLDYFRYPAEATEEEKDPAKLRALLERIRTELRAAAPACELSVDVYAYTSTIAQEWDEWLAAGLCDRTFAMNYAPDVPTLRRYMDRHPRNRQKQFCGIGATSSQSLLAPGELLSQLREAYRSGYAGAAIYPFDERFLSDLADLLRLAR